MKTLVESPAPSRARHDLSKGARRFAGRWLGGLAVSALLLLTAALPEGAEAQDTLKIGVLTDLSSAYTDLTGKGSIAAVEMAVEDFGGEVLGRKIEILTADHQLKPDIGVAIAGEWYDNDGVSAIFDIVGSSVSLAVANVAKARPNRVAVFSIALASDLVGKSCIPNGVHWAPDTYALTYPLVRGLTENGEKGWYLMLQDTAASTSIRAAAAKGIQDGGGEILGELRVPLNSPDVSSFVLQAQATGAKMLGLGTGGADVVNIAKTAKQFGVLQAGMKLVSFSMYSTDIDSMGQTEAQGMTLLTPFYATMTDQALDWAMRFQKRTGTMPAFSHANNYSSVRHYLAAVQKAGTDDAKSVIAAMKELPVNDFMTVDGRIREDHQLVRPMHLVRVKAPSESKFAGDYFDLITTIPGSQAFPPVSPDCPMASGEQ